jgi:hypothetical protein
MAIYPSEITLPYAVSNAWLEERTLAGETVDAIQRLTVALDTVTDDLRQRAASLLMDINAEDYAFTRAVEVISSGIEARSEKRTDGVQVRMDRPIIREIGLLPELPAPVEDARVLIDAYEKWRDRYCELAPAALRQWLDAWQTEDDPDADGRYPNGADDATFSTEMLLRINGDPAPRRIDGRIHDLNLFRRTRAAYMLYHHAAHLVDKDDWTFALKVAGTGAEADESLTDERALVLFEEYTSRLARVAFARRWTRERERNGFDLEMNRWTADYGSKRLKLGIEDGYRMIPIYLSERIAAEVPGFYAHLPKKDDGHTWQPRTGPSEEALRLRRAVQQRLNIHKPPGASAAIAEIGWIKCPPPQMCDERYSYDDHEWSEPTLKETPFEVIAVKEWLGRYSLIAAVYTEADEQPPDYLLLKYVIDPPTYGLTDMPVPPDGDSIADNAAKTFTAPVVVRGDDDIPF